MGRLIKNEWKEIATEQLKKAAWNYKRDDYDLKMKLKENIKKNNIIENLIVREIGKDVYEVVNGNHRLDIIKELKISFVMCCNLGTISEVAAERVAIETNETRFEKDDVKLAELFSAIVKDVSVEELSTTVNFAEDEIKNYVDLLSFNWNDYDKNLDTEYGATENDEFKTLSYSLPADIAAQLEEQIDRFKKALYPQEKDLSKVSYVMPLEAIIQHVAQIPDSQLVG